MQASARSPNGTPRSGWAPAARTPWSRPGSCPVSPGSGSLTGTRIISIPGGSTSPGTRRAFLTCCGTMRTARESYSGRGLAGAGAAGRCAASSMPAHAAREQGLDVIPALHAGAVEDGRVPASPSWPGWPACPRPRTEEQHEQKPGRELLNSRFRRPPQRRLLFTEDTSIHLAHEQYLERGVRLLKTQKVSGRLASDDVTQDRLDIRGYIDTAPQARPQRHGRPARPLCSAGPGGPGTGVFPVTQPDPRYLFTKSVNGLNAYIHESADNLPADF